MGRRKRNVAMQRMNWSWKGREVVGVDEGEDVALGNAEEKVGDAVEEVEECRLDSFDERVERSCS